MTDRDRLLDEANALFQKLARKYHDAKVSGDPNVTCYWALAYRAAQRFDRRHKAWLLHG
jgi:curved DNA-binding protein CbpA